MREIDKSSVEQPEITKSNNDKFVTKTNVAICQKNDLPKNRKFSGYDNEDTKKQLRILYSGGYKIKRGKKIYEPKCAYCESTVERVATLQIEHYRPKKAVTEDSTHKGYYWLAYEWTNLLYACPKCNGKSSKGNHFPIEGTRVFEEKRYTDNSIDYWAFDAYNPYLKGKKPLLLNPEVDRGFENMFVFEPTGEINGSNKQAKESIRIYDLKRDGLITARKNIVDKFVKNLKSNIKSINLDPTDLEAIELLKETFDEITNILPTDEYTLFRKYAAKNFETFFVSKIQPNYQQALRNAYQLYLDGSL